MQNSQDTHCFEEACEVLQNAQRVLARRLAERVVDAQQGILNDAEGNTYLSDIGEVYDEVGGRLVHVQQMLSCLKNCNKNADDSSRAVDGLGIFIELAREGDVESAGALLAELLHLDRERSVECAEYFCRQLSARPDFATEALQLRAAVQDGGVNDCLFGLTTCFGLHGDDLIQAFEGLRTS